MLTYIEDIWLIEEKSWQKHFYIKAMCDCWKETIIRRTKLKETKSCGCWYIKWNFKRRIQIEDWFKPEWSMLTFVKDLWKWNILTKCDCGNEKILWKDRFLKLQTKSCGCLKHRKWKDNPRYKWTTSKCDIIRTSKEYTEWRTKCFERDNYKCQVTWIKWNWDLVVHHLNPFHKLIVNTTEEDYYNYTPLWDIDNWITLLKSIHKEFHDKYWYNNFSKENFNDFLKEYRDR